MRSRFSSQIPARTPREPMSGRSGRGPRPGEGPGSARAGTRIRVTVPAEVLSLGRRAGRDQEVSGTPRASTPQGGCPGRAHRMTIPSMKPHRAETGAKRPMLSRVISSWATALPV